MAEETVVPSEEVVETPEETPVEETMEVPSEQHEAEAPTEEKEETTEQPVEPEVVADELYELPDGRKVDGAGVLEEYMSLQKDYTQKSQTLADIKKGVLPDNKTEENQYADPNYVPKTYDEIMAATEKRVFAKIESKKQEGIAQQKALEDSVVEQIATLKKTDSNLNENALFLHANKYGFRDLGQAYQNMKDMGKVAKDVQAKTVKDIKKRADPVSTANTKSSPGTTPDPSQFETARDFLHSIKE